MIDVQGYRFLREIGRGGTATVYLAEQESLGREVVIKLLAPHLARDPVVAQRFVREGRIAAGLRHRHIVQIFDVGVAEDTPYMALAWLPRGSLAQQAFPLDPVEALRLLREVGMALGHAHRAGVVHRDVKPENILLDEQDAFVLTDFGIAQLAGSSQSLTAEGSTLGTPAYMSPEQWQGGELDGRADLYSLGVVFYRCLVGSLPYQGKDGWSVGMQHMQAPLPLLPQALKQYQPLLDRLLAKQAGQRYADAGALLRAVDALQSAPGQGEDFAASLVVPAHPMADLFKTDERPVESPRERSRARRWRALAAAVVVLTTIAIAFAQRGRLGSALGNDPSMATLLVLPCESFANVLAHRELGDTLAQALIHRLSRLRELTVISRSTSLALSAKTRDPQALAEKSGATVVLSCSIRRSPDGVRIATELVETERGMVRWSADFERSSEDLLDIVDELAIGISERLIDQLAGPDRARLMRQRTDSLQALAHLEQAQADLRANTLVGIASARSQLDAALRSDPNVASASALLAKSYMQEAQLLGRDAQWLDAHAAPLLAQALRQDADAPLAYVLRSELACAAFSWALCAGDLQQALSLAPADATVQARASQVYRVLGPASRWLSAARRWVRSAPDSAEAWAQLSLALTADGRAQAGLDTAMDASRRVPDEPALWHARVMALVQLQRCADALRAVDQWRVLAPKDAAIDAPRAYLLACVGNREGLIALQRDFDRRLAVGDRVDDFSLAVLQLSLGETESALEVMERMYEARDPQLPIWVTQPVFGIEALARQPRFMALLDRLDLPASAYRWPARGTP